MLYQVHDPFSSKPLSRMITHLTSAHTTEKGNTYACLQMPECTDIIHL